MAEDAGQLTAAEANRVLAGITAWRAEPEAAVDCPRCGRSGLQVVDCSARPYAEWYALTCAHCGLDAMLNIPMAPPAV